MNNKQFKVPAIKLLQLPNCGATHVMYRWTHTHTRYDQWKTGLLYKSFML